MKFNTFKNNKFSDKKSEKMIPVRKKTFAEKHHLSPLHIVKWIAVIGTIFITFGIIWMSLFPKQTETSMVKNKIGNNVGAFQQIGNINKDKIVYSGNKAEHGYVWIYDKSKHHVSKPEYIITNNDEKISYLTQIQLSKNLKKYKLSKDKHEVIYKGQHYTPIYGYASNANATELQSVKGKKDRKIIKLKPVNLYITDQNAIKEIKKKYHFDTKKMVLTQLNAKKDGSIDYYIISLPHANPYCITVKKNGEVLIAKGHTN